MPVVKGSTYRPVNPRFDHKSAREKLAGELISKRQLAEASGLSYGYVVSVLAWTTAPSEESLAKIEAGLRKLGITLGGALEAGDGGEGKA